VSFCPTIVLLLVRAMAALSGEGRPEGERLARHFDKGLPSEGHDGDDIHKDITGGVDGPKGCASAVSMDPVLLGPPEQAIAHHCGAINQVNAPATVSNEEPQIPEHRNPQYGPYVAFCEVCNYYLINWDEHCRCVVYPRRPWPVQLVELATEQAVEDKDRQSKNRGPANKVCRCVGV
jgi:hypothetical protein